MNCMQHSRHVCLGCGIAAIVCSFVLLGAPRMTLGMPAPMQGAAAAWQVSLGQTADQVIAILGEPDQIVDFGARVIYGYKGREIEFTDGRVTHLDMGKSVPTAEAKPTSEPSQLTSDAVTSGTLQPVRDMPSALDLCQGPAPSGVKNDVKGLIRILGGSGAFSGLSSSNKVVTVHAGSQLTGSVHLHVVNGGSPDAVTPLIGTVSWGEGSHFFWTVASSVRVAEQNLDAQVRITAPKIVGTDYVLFAMQLGRNGWNVASGSNWDVDRDTWGDGNDIAQFSPAQILQAQQKGCATDRWLTAKGYELTVVPADAITLHVI